MRYGLPYKGSKNKIAEWVVSHFPDVDNLYDLFGGGGAITHCSLLNKDFKKIYYNDLEKGLTQLFKDSVNGKYKNETEWISREEFFKRKDKDLYIRYCWSFGNDGKTYLYAEEKESWKKALHYAKVLNDFSLFEEMGINLNINEKDKEKRKTLINSELKKKRLEFRLESLERLQSLESLERLNIKKISFLNKSYDDILIKENSIIYCDIPYKDVSGYLCDFNYNLFYDWCSKQKELIIISEYNMPEDKFICIDKIEKNILFSKKVDSLKKYNIKEEKLFIPIHQKDLYEKLIKKED